MAGLCASLIFRLLVCLALFNLVVVKLQHLFITYTLIHLEHGVIINYVNEGHHYEWVVINQNFPLIITERYQFNDTTGCGKQALNGSVSMSGSCEKAVLIYTALSNRYESLLKTPQNPIITTNQRLQSGALCTCCSAAHSVLWNTCDNGNSVQFWFGEHKSGMEVRHADGMKSHQQVL